MQHPRARSALAVVGGLLLAGCSVPVASNLGEGEANRAVVALEQGGVYASKEPDPINEGRWLLSVARDDAAGAVAVLRQENLPGPETVGVLDALGKGNLVSSRTQEQAKLLVGTAGELEQSLRELDGVLSARVHLAVSPGSALDLEAERPKPTASVLLRHRGASPPISIAAVKELVAGAVPGLSEQAVKVVASSVPRSAAAPERSLARFGPITVTHASLMPMKLLVAAVVLLNLVLVGLLALLWNRARRLELRVQSGEGEGDSDGDGGTRSAAS
jgi:type III secretion protein J